MFQTFLELDDAGKLIFAWMFAHFYMIILKLEFGKRTAANLHVNCMHKARGDRDRITISGCKLKFIGEFQCKQKSEIYPENQTWNIS